MNNEIKTLQGKDIQRYIEEEDAEAYDAPVAIEIMDSNHRIRDVIPASAVWYDSETDMLIITAHSDDMPQH